MPPRYPARRPSDPSDPLIGAWLTFPLLLAALALGCGLLADRASRRAIPGSLIVPVGLAVIVVAGDLLTRWADAASLTPWALVALAVAGFVLGLRDRLRAPEWSPVAVALSVFAVYAAPIVLSGEATFAGYVTLDDTATWLAITDQLMDRGHDLSQLPPSSHEATLAFTLAKGYPVGSFLPLGTGASITGIDPAWAFQPYLAFLGACLGLALWSLLRPLVPSSGLRGLCAFIAAQPALLFGYALWGGVKELIAAALIATLAALVRSGRAEDIRERPVIPLAIVAAALLSALSAGGLVWVVPILAAPIAVRLAGHGGELRPGWPVVIAVGALSASCVLALALGIRPAPKGAFGLVDGEVLGNLIGPLSPLQIAGVWPSGDFRIDPDQKLLAYLLVAAVAGLFGLGAWRAIRSRAVSLLAYGVGTVVVALSVVAIASPWLGAKALAIASPAALTLAVGGAASLRGRRTEMVVALGVLAAGALWSNLLAFGEVRLAPRERLGELERLGAELAGEGPTLMTEYEPYGVRHFLRDAAPEGVSELRRREIPLRDGTLAPKGDSVDTNEIRLDALLTYRTLVLRRSPLASRLPASYRLVSRGRYYDVWQRPGTILVRRP